METNGPKFCCRHGLISVANIQEMNFSKSQIPELLRRRCFLSPDLSPTFPPSSSSSEPTVSHCLDRALCSCLFLFFSLSSSFTSLLFDSELIFWINFEMKLFALQLIQRNSASSSYPRTPSTTLDHSVLQYYASIVKHTSYKADYLCK